MHMPASLEDNIFGEHPDTIKNIWILNLCQATYLKILCFQEVTRIRLCSGIDLS